MSERSCWLGSMAAALGLALAACGMAGEEDDTPPPPPEPQSQPNAEGDEGRNGAEGASTGPAQPSTHPSTQASTQAPTPQTGQPPSGQPPDAILASTSPPALIGAYEAQWMENPGRPRQEFPGVLLNQLPDCFWGRFTFVFDARGGMRLRNELLCRDPFEIRGDRDGFGVCQAETRTAVWWSGSRFRLPIPADGRSTLELHYPGRRGSFDSFRANCTVGLSPMVANLTDIEPGESPDRPRAVTLDGGHLRIRLVATDQEEIDHQALIRERMRQR